MYYLFNLVSPPTGTLVEETVETMEQVYVVDMHEGEGEKWPQEGAPVSGNDKASRV